MKVSEDRYPLLFVRPDNQEDQPDVRTRSLTKGAAQVLVRWPQYLTFVTYMSVLGLLTILVCFVLSVVLLSLTFSEYRGPKGVEKCGDAEGATELSHLKSVGHLSDNTTDATFIVDVPHSENGDRVIACGVESYLSRTSLPVYFVHVKIGAAPRNLSQFKILEANFRNFKMIVVEADSLLRETMFRRWEVGNSEMSRLLIEVLISWNFGGTVLDSKMVAVSQYGDILGPGRKGLVIGTWSSNVVLISTARVCHSFVFSLMKQLRKEGPETKLTQTDVLGRAYEKFCGGKDDCRDLNRISEPFFCDSDLITDQCIFATATAFASYDSALVWSRVCPLVSFP